MAVKVAAVASLALAHQGSGAVVSLMTYQDEECQSVKTAGIAGLETWDVSPTGCCTVTGVNGTRYLQYVCVDGGLLELTYAEEGCRGGLKQRRSKTRSWWQTIHQGGCAFNDAESTYVKFNLPPPSSITSYAGECNAPPALQMYRYRDPLCTVPSGEEELKKQTTKFDNQCLDVTLAGPEGSRRVGTKFQCSNGQITHDTFKDYLYCSGNSERRQVHTWSWFEAYSSGECVQDLAAGDYLKLTSKVPDDWVEHVAPCRNASEAKMTSFSNAGCKGATRAEKVLEWQDISADGCITVVQTNSSLPIYSQRFKCLGSGDSKKIVLDTFAGTLCSTPLLDAEAPLEPELEVAQWLQFLAGACVSASSDSYHQLAGLSPEAKGKLLMVLEECTSALTVDVVQSTTSPEPALRGKAVVPSSAGVRSSLAAAVAVLTLAAASRF
eukprot:TRINITY_DN2102_c0_g1_i1.p1 TRINITY_DN2102_c0_g1~~TRINITY_DN2102_c0_g1_i1.p1  ORF type:complete len:456 (+),score=108.18 TRINITY_DN2102_c0_g1_i1:56-1369(+)